MCDCMCAFFSIMARSFGLRCEILIVWFEGCDRVRVWRSDVDSVFVSKFVIMCGVVVCDMWIRFGGINFFFFFFTAFYS